MRARRVARRTSRRTARRTSRRTFRRMRRRRLILGGFTVLAIGGAAYGTYKLATKDVQRIEQHTGKSADDLTEEELVAAMRALGIEKIELTGEDKAAIATETGQAPSGATQPAEAPPSTAAAAPKGDYLDDLERLAKLRDQGVLTEEEFAAKKREILGL